MAGTPSVDGRPVTTHEGFGGERRRNLLTLREAAAGRRQTWRLYLFRGDRADTLWRRRGWPAPSHPPPPEVEMHWLSAAEWERAPSLLPTPERRVRERFGEGARCLIMQRRESGELVYHLWLTTTGAWIGWIGARVAPPEDFALVFDVWADPRWRRGRLHIPGATEVARVIDSLGLQGMVAGVEAHEVVPSALMYARAGLGFMAPYEVILWHRLGPLSWHRRAPPPAHLVERCAEIRRRHEEP